MNLLNYNLRFSRPFVRTTHGNSPVALFKGCTHSLSPCLILLGDQVDKMESGSSFQCDLRRMMEMSARTTHLTYVFTKLDISLYETACIPIH